MTSQVATESRVPVWMITWPSPKSPDEVLAVWRDDLMETITVVGDAALVFHHCSF